MSDKQTRCPKCTTIYKVTLTQLTVAQGMVCCPKCGLNFNALTHLVQPETSRPTPSSSEPREMLLQCSGQSGTAHILDIFSRKIEHSNIDLRTYLNNLNYFHNDPIGNYPALNLSSSELNLNSETEKSHSWGYYAFWASINLFLLLVLIFQIFWFNPKLLNHSPILGQMFNPICQALQCNVLQQQYSSIIINKVKVKRLSKHETRFSGVLLNQQESSLLLPKLKVTLHTDGEEVTTYTLKANEYLVQGLRNIQRIPHDRPFKFEFVLPVERKSFDNYSLEIISP